MPFKGLMFFEKSFRPVLGKGAYLGSQCGCCVCGRVGCSSLPHQGDESCSGHTEGILKLMGYLVGREMDGEELQSDSDGF